MQEEHIKTITIEDLKLVASETMFSNREIVAMKASVLPAFTESVYVKCFTIIVCLRGEFKLSINGVVHSLNEEQCAFIVPGSFINPLIKEGPFDYDAKIVAFEPDIIEGVHSLKKEKWKIGCYLYRNPILHTDKKISYKAYLFKELLFTLIKEPQTPLIEDAIHHIFIASFCDLMMEISKNIPIGSESLYDIPKSHHIFKEFVDMVLSDDGTHRSVAYFAKQLCYSPKHLSSVVKQACGKSPLKIINEHAMRLIKDQLLRSDKSMKEIAEMFKFPNPSFFGKFVKANTGKSPQQYRNTAED